jgi:drug/metabolite transporter (DMT)-like permease
MIIGTIGLYVFTPHLIREIPDSNLTTNLLVIFLGIFPSSLGFLSWSYALGTAQKVAHVTVFAYLIPFISALIAYFWLGETLTIFAFFGGIIIILGMIMTNVLGRKEKKQT